MVPETAVADTGPLLHLAQIGAEGLLALFSRLTISAQVADELRRHGAAATLELSLPDVLTIATVGDDEIVAARHDDPAGKLSVPDWSVVVLARRLAPDVSLTDDLALRRALEDRGYLVVGSIGIVLRALSLGSIDVTDAKSSLDRLSNGSTLYLSTGLRRYVKSLIEDMTS